MSKLMQSAKENVAFLGVCLLVIAVIFIIASLSEKWLRKKNHMPHSESPARRVAIVGMFSAISGVLMYFEVPLWFAPSFYELDFSEIPVLICGFSMGPVAGVAAELCKVLIKLFLKGTSTAFVGELANFMVGCAMILPATIIYYHKKTKKTALLGMIVGTLIMTVFGSAFNGMYLIPKFSQLFGLPLEAIVSMGTAVNPAIRSVWTLVLFAVVPFNLLKGAIVSVFTMLLYKHISPILKGRH